MKKSKEYKWDPFEYEGSAKVIVSLSEPLTFTQIKKQTNLNPTTLNDRLDHLISKGFIDKVIDQSDRKPKYELTDVGRTKYSSLTGKELTEQIFSHDIIKRPIMEVIGEIASYYKTHPDKNQALNEAKNQVIEPLRELLFRIFKDLGSDMSKEDVDDLLEKGWKMILQMWEEKKEEK